MSTQTLIRMFVLLILFLALILIGGAIAMVYADHRVPDWSGSSIDDEDWSDTDLNGLICDYCFVDESVFDGAEIQRSEWYKAVIDDSSFRCARLEESNFSHADIEDTDFTCATIRGAAWTRSRCKRCEFPGGNFSGAKLRKANFDRTYMPWCNLQNADLRGWSCRYCNLYGCDMRGVKTNSDTDLTGANMVNTKK